MLHRLPATRKKTETGCPGAATPPTEILVRDLAADHDLAVYEAGLDRKNKCDPASHVKPPCGSDLRLGCPVSPETPPRKKNNDPA
jgi:hypothetical protein